ncbi:MAG: hypothetical protein ACLPY5_05950 [Candidatus Bathyarchaeia archaeon]
MPSIILLVGEANSGKSATLRTLVEKYLDKTKGKRENFFEYNGKGICIYPSSPQENSDNPFCNSQKIIESIDRRISECNLNNCTLLITTFTLKGDQKTGESLNEPCIEIPIQNLSKHFKVQVVYLKQNGSRSKSPRALNRLKRIDNLMQRLKNYEIESHNDQEKRQADELWDIVMKVDS